MPGLVPGIHVFAALQGSKTWMAGTSVLSGDMTDTYSGTSLTHWLVVKSMVATVLAPKQMA